MKLKPYNIIQYITIDKYVTLAELSKKTGTNKETLKKQLAKLKIELEETGYRIETCVKGIKLVNDESEYLPSDLLLFKSVKFDFIKMFIMFISNGLEDKNIFRVLYRDMYYTDRQMNYFFESKLNMSFSEFKSKNNFEYFTLFVECSIVDFNCRNIKKIFNQYLSIKSFNSIMLSRDNYMQFSPDDYLTIYSILVFDKINTAVINDEFIEINNHFHNKDFSKGLELFRSNINYTKNKYTTNAMIEYYYSLRKIKNKETSLNQKYKMFETIAIELENIQKQLTTKIVSSEQFDLTIIYEGTESHLAVIKGTLRGNYPNITINLIPSWVYLYGNLNFSGVIFSNTCINDSIPVIPARDKNGNYNIDKVM